MSCTRGHVEHQPIRRAHALLVADDGFSGLMCRDRVGVPMHETPVPVFLTVGTGHSETNPGETVAIADPRLKALDFGHTRQSVRNVCRQRLDP